MSSSSAATGSGGEVSSSGAGGGSGGGSLDGHACGSLGGGPAKPLEWGSIISPKPDWMTVAIRDDGRVALSGSFHGSIDFSAGSLTAADGGSGYLVSYDASGTLLGSRTIDRPALQIAFDPAGDLVLLGADQSQHVAKLTADGDTVWEAALQGMGVDMILGLRVDSAGNILLAGSAYGPVSFGPLTTDVGPSGMFVLKLDPSGAPLWLTAVPFPMKNDAQTPPSFILTDLSVDAAGTVAAFGMRSYGVIVGQEKLDTRDSGIVTIDAGGSILWSRSFEVAPGDTSSVVDAAIDAQGRVAVSGGFKGTADLGVGPITSADGARFLAMYDATGAPLWTQETPCAGGRITFDADGNLVLFNGDVVRLDPSGAPLGASFYDNSISGFMDVAFGPSGLIVATGEAVGAGQVIDFGQGPQTLEPHKGAFVGAMHE